MNRTLSVKKRIKIVLMVLVGLHVCIIARAVYVGEVHGDELRARGKRQSMRIIPLPARRGYIFDRNGVTLAMDVPFPSVFAIPSMISRPADYSKRLSAALGIPPSEIAKFLKNKKKNFVWLKRTITEYQAAAIKDLNLKGIVIVREAKRMYPNGSTCGVVVGFKGEDAGKEGVELSMNKQLQGRDGFILLEKDPLGRNIPQSISEKKPVKHGKDVYLTIMLPVQRFAEESLEETVPKFNAKGGSAVVIEVKTGRILAMASYPTYDPNKYVDYIKTPIRFRNKTIWYMFEPGSAMKPLVAAAAIDAGAVDPFKEEIYCEPSIIVGGKTIKEDHGAGLPALKSVKDIIAHSYNTGAARIALRLGGPRLFKAFMRYNFGHKFDFALAGQATGLVPDYRNVTDLTVANNAFGQGISVTQLQIAMATAAVANGGVLMQPAIVEKIVDQDGKEVYTFEPKPIRRVVSEETSKIMRYIMHMVVEEGTGESAKVEGYQIAGKTGTAQIPGPHGYKTGEYFSSFVGFAPAEDPEILVMVSFEAPRPVYYAAAVAAPAFQEVMKKSLWYLKIPPSPEKEPVGY
jgi:stage V sporulation protein D (sporulation-specific penicillin-binding protein)